MDKRIKVALKTFQTLYGHIDELENYFNVRLSEMSVPDLVVFKSSLDKVKVDVVAFSATKL